MKKQLNMKSWLMNAVTTFAALLVLLTAALMFVGYKATNPAIRLLESNPSHYDLEYEEVQFSNKFDHISLSGWWIPSEHNSIFNTDKAVIFAHGYGYNRTEMPFSPLQLASRLSEEGYHVFMFDFRNSGMSEQAPTTFGGNEKTDLLSAIDYVSETRGVEDIALMGWSMGAVTSIMAGAESEEVKAVIADSPFANLSEYAADSFEYWTGLPKSFATGTTRAIGVMVPGFNPTDVTPLYAAQSYPDDKGLFLIHSMHDGAIPYSESEAIHNSAAGSELWLPEKGGHIRSYFHFESEYEERVLQFLDRHFIRHEPFISDPVHYL
ncbi:alpha/beta fold hydrolase [Alkalihalobacillus sp. LMS6]|uniref:alpha/beta hydrolase n=1 Tax=Alkalihalobacillus sp. LMS6 TaxID=2924034 RepID=UPI0020D1F0E4|nr:alpha/beta fold hydrolase [Alkalihalobacillus sp. LMS6]UTR07366.1 alpha/beta fold hydrolase [Alkalihalobacillus sp. LMS6]